MLFRSDGVPVEAQLNVSLPHVLVLWYALDGDLVHHCSLLLLDLAGFGLACRTPVGGRRKGRVDRGKKA